MRAAFHAIAVPLILITSELAWGFPCRSCQAADSGEPESSAEANALDPLAKEHAVELSGTVRGVSSIIDRIRIEPIEARSDEASIQAGVTAALKGNPATARVEIEDDRVLREDVEDRWTWSPDLDSRDIRVEVDDGVVMLEGQVGSEHQRQIAGARARAAGARLRSQPILGGRVPTRRLRMAGGSRTR